ARGRDCGNDELIALPRGKVCGRLSDHDDPHPRVLIAAELGAGSKVRAGFVGADPDVIRMTRYRVDLAPQLRHPEVVNHVGGFDIDQNRTANWNVNLVGRDGSRAEVIGLPPPLMTYHPQIGRVSGDRRIRGMNSSDGEAEDHDQQQRGNHSPDYFEPRIPELLARVGSALT